MWSGKLQGRVNNLVTTKASKEQNIYKIISNVILSYQYSIDFNGNFFPSFSMFQLKNKDQNRLRRNQRGTECCSSQHKQYYDWNCQFSHINKYFVCTCCIVDNVHCWRFCKPIGFVYWH